MYFNQKEVNELRQRTQLDPIMKYQEGYLDI